MHAMSRPLTIVTFASALAACSAMNLAGPGAIVTKSADVPAAIAAPSGARLALTLKGAGLQNYECRAKAEAGGYGWVFVAPEAVLRDKADAIVGKHYAGPTWEYGDGSKVSGKVIADVPAPQAGSIPWLLLQGTSASRSGTLDGVIYIQRTNTSGGIAPSDSCTSSTIGMKKATRYTADYLFYKR
ncbi:MAG: DUF3455 domain-containing protein [Burkholderiaceae bacterium]